MSTTKHTTIEQLKKLALRTKSEIGLVDAKVTGLTTKVNDLVTAGGEPNKLEGIKGERRQCNHKRADDFPVRYNADR